MFDEKDKASGTTNFESEKIENRLGNDIHGNDDDFNFSSEKSFGSGFGNDRGNEKFRNFGNENFSDEENFDEENVAPEADSEMEGAFEIGREPGQLPVESPFDDAESARFRVIRYDEAGYSLEEFSNPDHLAKFADEKSGVVWIQMMGMKEPDFVHVVGALFNIPMLAQEDVLSVWSRPKFEEYGEDVILAVARAVRLSVEEDHPRGQQISFVAGKNFLISFHEKRELIFESIERRIAENSGKIRNWGSPYLLYTLIDTLVDRILFLSDSIEDAISDLEDEVVKTEDRGDPDGEISRKIYNLKRIVVRIGRMIYPLRDMVRMFERYEHPLLPPEMDMYFGDLYDHTLRSFDRIDHSRMILQELQSFYHTERERRTSEIIRVLTVVTAIFIPLTFVVGIYGMNFDNMPELRTTYGYFCCLGIMLLAAIATFIFFRVKRWI